MLLRKTLFRNYFSIFIPASKTKTLKDIKHKYYWCPVNNISNFGNYTWNEKFTEGDIRLKSWPAEKSRDPKMYINLEKFVVMDFCTCEKGTICLSSLEHLKMV